MEIKAGSVVELDWGVYVITRINDPQLQYQYVGTQKRVFLADLDHFISKIVRVLN